MDLLDKVTNMDWGCRKMKEKGSSIKVSGGYKDFIENIISTRRSKIVGTDKKRLTQIEAGDLLVKFFKLNNNLF